MSEKTLNQFLVFLRAGVQGRQPDVQSLGDSIDWAELYKLSYQQTLVGFVTDGIDLLEGPLRPLDETLDPFLGDLMGMEMRAATMESSLVKLVTLLESNGLHPLVVKGQPLAREYPKPSHRQCGDIDFLLTPEEYDKAREIMIPRASTVLDEYREILHQGLKFKSIEVELHGAVSTLMSPALDAKLAVLTEQMFREGEFRRVEIGDTEVLTPPLWYSAMYIFVHMLHHFWSRGVSLRQILDWSMFVTNHYDEFDMKRLDEVVTGLGIKHLWQVFAGFGEEVFDLPPDRFPFYVKTWRRKNKRILRFVIRGGNFGKNFSRKRKKQESYFRRKVVSFFRLVVHDRLRHFPTFPRESLRYFCGAFKYGLVRLSKGE